MKLKMKKEIAFVALFLLTVLSYAQLTVNNSYTTTQLVQDVFLGAGVSVSNISYNGASKAIGYFNGTNSNIGLDSGLVLTSGDIANAVGPNGTGSKSTSNSLNGDADLTALSGFTTYDASVLEFDFVSTSNKVTFRYVFGSEEYHEYVNSFNDVFAFFISGPGITGTKNIALIPGTSTYVSINNVNLNKNNTYFFDNEKPKGLTVQYDGFTTVLEAIADSLIPGQTYHIKIGIADAVDHSYDSGVFLEAKSFKGNVLTSLTILPPGNDTTLFEGCGQAKLTFIKSALASSDTVYLSYSGTAINGVDYALLPDTLIFTTTDTIELYFDALVDSIVEGPEDLLINVTSINGTDTVTIPLNGTINDIVPLTISSSNDTTLLCPNSLTFSTLVNGGTGNYNYLWSTADTISSINVLPLSSTTYIITVSDTCGVLPISDSVKVFIPVTDTLKLNLSSDTSLFCPAKLILYAHTKGGSGNNLFYWTSLSTNDSSHAAYPLVTTTYTVTVIDTCGNKSTDDVTITLPSVSKLSASISNDTTLYCPAEITLVSQGSGGYGNYQYVWDNASTSSTINVSPTSTTQYLVSVTDSCKLDTIIKTVNVSMPFISPLSMILPNDTNLCKGESIWVSPIVSGGQQDYTFLWNGLPYEEDSMLLVADSTNSVIISVKDSCGTTVSGTVQVTALVFVASFIATPITENHINFNAIVTGGTVLEWDFGDGATSNEQDPEHIYEQEGTYTVMVVVQNSIGCLDTLYSTIVVFEEFNLGSVFTPNSDGVNDYFEIPNSGLEEFEIKIYNRWGRLMFETTDEAKYWDGKTKSGSDAVSGTYFYIIKAISPFSDYSNNGFITLIRD